MVNKLQAQVSRSLSIKLTLAFLVVSLTGVALVAALMWGISSMEFNRFLTDRGLNSYSSAVTNYYKTNGAWTGISDVNLPQSITTSVPDNPNAGNPNGYTGPDTQNNPNQLTQGGHPHNFQPPIPYVLIDPSGNVLLGNGPIHPGETLDITRFPQNVAVTVDNQTVGYVLVAGRTPNLSPLEQRYITRINQSLIIAAIGAVIIAVLLGLLLARAITRPVRDLTAASRLLAKGNFNQRVPVRSHDELGELSQTFNQMSADLEHSNQLRQQMTADIAHDLRTPLAVITGYLEGLKDGVLKPTSTRFSAMYDEAQYLQRLIEDLRTLSLADAGELKLNNQVVQPVDVILRLATSFEHEAEKKKIHLTTAVDDTLPPVKIDPERMQQVLCNLVSNALRYTPEDGEICLAARRENSHVAIEVRDSGAGIAPDVLPHVFNRFYRGDGSRHDEGSGLGLAIAKSIVELEGGQISAFSAGLGQGSAFTIQLPAAG